MYMSSDGCLGAGIFLAILIGIVGWAVIELLLWLLSFVNISFGG